MKYKHLSTLILIAMMHSPAWAASIRKEKPVRQVSVQRIDSMPDMPGSYRMIDWKAKAKAFDAYVFDWNNTDKMGPLIWKDDARRNVDQTTFGLYTAIGDVRQGPDNNGGEFHEALKPAILSDVRKCQKPNTQGFSFLSWCFIIPHNAILPLLIRVHFRVRLFSLLIFVYTGLYNLLKRSIAFAFNSSTIAI